MSLVGQTGTFKLECISHPLLSCKQAICRAGIAFPCDSSSCEVLTQIQVGQHKHSKSTANAAGNVDEVCSKVSGGNCLQC